MRGRQVAAVRAEAEHEDSRSPRAWKRAISGRRRRGGPGSSHPGTGARSGSWSESKATRRTPGGRWMTRPVCLHVGEGQAGDRLIAEQVKAVGWQFQLPGDRGRPGQRIQALESLSDPPAEPRGPGPGPSVTRTGFRASCDRRGGSGHAVARKVKAARLAPIARTTIATVATPARPGDPAIPQTPPPEPLDPADRPRPDRPALQVAPQLVRQLGCRGEPVLWGPWPAPSAPSSPGPAECGGRAAATAPAARA